MFWFVRSIAVVWNFVAAVPPVEPGTALPAVVSAGEPAGL